MLVYLGLKITWTKDFYNRRNWLGNVLLIKVIIMALMLIMRSWLILVMPLFPSQLPQIGFYVWCLLCGVVCSVSLGMVTDW